VRSINKNVSLSQVYLNVKKKTLKKIWQRSFRFKSAVLLSSHHISRFIYVYSRIDAFFSSKNAVIVLSDVRRRSSLPHNIHHRFLGRILCCYYSIIYAVYSGLGRAVAHTIIIVVIIMYYHYYYYYYYYIEKHVRPRAHTQ